MTRIVVLFLITFSASAQDLSVDIINDPSISRRCQSLLQKRQKKIDIKNRLQGLKLRNERLQKITPKNKVSVKTKLERNLGRIGRELRLVKLKITDLEETIVRQGCPGISP